MSEEAHDSDAALDLASKMDERINAMTLDEARITLGLLAVIGKCATDIFESDLKNTFRATSGVFHLFHSVDHLRRHLGVTA